MEDFHKGVSCELFFPIESCLPGQVTEVTGDRALVAGTNTLCGAIATLWRGIQKLVKGARCSIVEAIEAATLHPAQVRPLNQTTVRHRQ